jgi:hypothetical protein
MAEIVKNQEFARRTEKLVAALDEKNRELEKLAVVMESISPLPGMDPEKYLMLAAGGEEAPDFRDGKIVALAKKTRKLTEALRKEKSMATKLMRENESLEKKCAQLEGDVVDAMKSGAAVKPMNEEESDNLITELKRTKKEASGSGKTIDELRRKLHLAEQRTKAVERAMAKELGDNVKLEDVMPPAPPCIATYMTCALGGSPFLLSPSPLLPPYLTSSLSWYLLTNPGTGGGLGVAGTGPTDHNAKEQDTKDGGARRWI